jgi:hypothetical protein
MLSFALLAGFAVAALSDPAPDPAPDLDYALQGEYLGTVHAAAPDTTAPLGAQVVAQGQGAFKIVFFPGGLPGGGARGDRHLAKGIRLGSELAIADSVYTGGISGDTLKGFAGPGAPFTLSKRIRVSPTLGLQPPAGATILFGGGEPAAWTNAARDEEGNLTPREREARTLRAFAGFSLHLEFRMPFLPEAVGPARGNSGVRFLDDSFLYAEIQLLDSFGGDTGSEECGGIEGLYAGRVMAAFPPLAWQTMDIQVSTPPDTAGEGALTVWQNGILIHSRRKIPRFGKQVYVALQSLDSTGAFRNVWLVEGDDGYPLVTDAVKAPRRGRKPAPGGGDFRGWPWKGGFYGIEGSRKRFPVDRQSPVERRSPTGR